MQKAKIKLKIEVSREFEDYVEEQYIEQVVMRVANRIVSELRWQIENPGLATEERLERMRRKREETEDLRRQISTTRFAPGEQLNEFLKAKAASFRRKKA